MTSSRRHQGQQQQSSRNGGWLAEDQDDPQRPGAPQPRRQGLYDSLFDDLEPDEQQWVINVLARQAAAEQQADRSGQPLPRPLF